MPAAEIIFASKPGVVLFGGDQSMLQHFARAICYKTFSLQQGSEEWCTFITDLTKVTQMEVFTATEGDLEGNPMQILIYSILDIARILTSGDLPDESKATDLYFVKHFADKENGCETLMSFSSKYRSMSPFVNLYVTLCATSLGWVANQIPVEDAMTKLN